MNIIYYKYELKQRWVAAWLDDLIYRTHPQVSIFICSLWLWNVWAGMDSEGKHGVRRNWKHSRMHLLIYMRELGTWCFIHSQGVKKHSKQVNRSSKTQSFYNSFINDLFISTILSQTSHHFSVTLFQLLYFSFFHCFRSSKQQSALRGISWTRGSWKCARHASTCLSVCCGFWKWPSL